MEAFGDVGHDAEAGADIGGDEVNMHACGAHEDAGAGTAVLKDELPLFMKGRGIVRSKPVLVIEKDVV